MNLRPTFAGRWADAVAARGTEPFLVFLGADGHTTAWTYAAFDRLVARVAGRLVAHGVGPGSAVHLAVRNSPAFVATWLAVARLSAWMVPSDPQVSPAELAEQLRRTGPVVGVCGLDGMLAYRDAVEQAATDTIPVAVDEDDPEPASLLGEPFVPQPPAARPRDRLAVLFTPRTAAAPKGVELTQANYAFAGDVMAAAAALRPDDRHLVVLPVFAASEQLYSVAPAISAGASVALVHRFSASGFLVQARVLEATCASLLAESIRMTLDRTTSPVEGLVVRHCWYADDLSRDEHEQFSGLVGCGPRQLYGTAETVAAVVTDRALAPGPDATGHPALGCELRVVDGELQVGGIPGETLFAGYLDDPAATQLVTERPLDGTVWFATGEQVRTDDHGRLVLTGRRSDVLDVAGE